MSTPQIHSSKMTQEQREYLQPEFLANEEAYWRNRESLLKAYREKWIAYDENQGVIQTADSFLEIGKDIRKVQGNPYVAWVGREDDFLVKMRRSFGYDTDYAPTALPRAVVTFSNANQTQSQMYSDVIPDTGADLSSLTPDDLPLSNLGSGPSIPTQTMGVTGQPVAAALYPAFATMNGTEFQCFVQILPSLERILGRDVLNQIRVIFDGPNNQVEFELS